MNAAPQLPIEDMRHFGCELFQIGLLELRSRRKRSMLTPAKARIASMLAEGFTRDEIAAEMGITGQTLKGYLSEIYRSLGLNHPTLDSRVKLAVYWNCELFQAGLQATA